MSKSARVDGLGRLIDPCKDYFIQDTRQYVGNTMLFWGPDRSGYLCCIDDAGRYPGTHLPGSRDTDVAWPVDFIESVAARYVDFQRVQVAKDALTVVGV